MSNACYFMVRRTSGMHAFLGKRLQLLACTPRWQQQHQDTCPCPRAIRARHPLTTFNRNPGSVVLVATASAANDKTCSFQQQSSLPYQDILVNWHDETISLLLPDSACQPYQRHVQYLNLSHLGVPTVPKACGIPSFVNRSPIE